MPVRPMIVMVVSVGTPSARASATSRLARFGSYGHGLTRGLYPVTPFDTSWPLGRPEKTAVTRPSLSTA
jgi:hypothetical protein